MAKNLKPFPFTAKKINRPLTVCGCNCQKCYCTEHACNTHSHCFGDDCNISKLIIALLLSLRDDIQTISTPICGPTCEHCGDRGFVKEKKASGKYRVMPCPKCNEDGMDGISG